MLVIKVVYVAVLDRPVGALIRGKDKLPKYGLIAKMLSIIMILYLFN